MTVYNFYYDLGRFPNEDEGLRALCFADGITGWNGSYFGSSIDEMRDRWGNEFLYEYSVETNEAKVISKGSDGILNTEDDIVSTISAEQIQRSRQSETLNSE